MNEELDLDFYNLDDIAYAFTQKEPFQGSAALAVKKDGEIPLAEDKDWLQHKKLSKVRHLLRYKFISLMAYGKQVLDYGCGCGYGTFILSKNAKSVYGMDLDSKAIEFAKRYNNAKNIHYINDGSYSDSFDLIVAVEVLEHIPPRKVKAFVSNLRKSLADNGLMVFTTPIMDKTITHHLVSSLHDHYREYNKEGFVKVLNKNSLKIKQYLLQKYDGSLVYQVPKDTSFGKQLNLGSWVQIAVCGKENGYG